MLNPEVDFEINIHDLSEEFRSLPRKLHGYYAAKASAERELDKAKGSLEEIKAIIYKELRSSGEKKTEKTLEAEVETHEMVQQVQKMVFDAKHDFNTLIGGVESMKAKQNMLMQLGADQRKEK